MIELLKNLDWIAFGTAVAGIIGALTSLVIVLVQAKSSRKISNALDAAKQRETYIECPHCKKKIPLSQVSFHLPDGAIDNNLNGLPDHSEKM